MANCGYILRSGEKLALDRSYSLTDRPFATTCQPGALWRQDLQPHILHRRLVLLRHCAVDGDMLVDRQGFPPGMPSDGLQLGVGQSSKWVSPFLFVIRT
jgi:hypothetical protein